MDLNRLLPISHQNHFIYSDLRPLETFNDSDYFTLRLRILSSTQAQGPDPMEARRFFMDLNAINIRLLTRCEFDLAIDWAAAEGWNPGHL